MAGTNKFLKENELLFQLGDPADCMYIIRKGTLKVYFTKGAEEVKLAELKDGSIVGEMAFFDEKPRSASVKATSATEVTVITRADFDKLLTQVPKWVVTMMQSLSSRLRQTNEKLQALEASRASSGNAGTEDSGALLLPNQSHPFQHVLRALKILVLALSRDGQKEGSSISLPLASPKQLWTDFFNDGELFEKILSVTEQTRFIVVKLDAQKNKVIVFPNRGAFVHFSDFMGNTVKQFTPLKPFFSTDAIALYNAMLETAVASGYETYNVSLQSLLGTARAKGIDVANWAKAVGELSAIPELKMTKSANDVTVRMYLKEHKLVGNYLNFMNLYNENKLA